MSQKLSYQVIQKPTICDIEIEYGMLSNPQKLISLLSSYGSRCAIITNEKLCPLYGEKVKTALEKGGFTVYLFSFPDGEKYKSREMKEVLENQMFEAGLGRDTFLIALGGGVVTDMVGYIAATYCRGVPFVMIPTSLLSMVDASLGGKNGVNVAYGKNLIGTIYHPKKILIDPEILKTIPIEELRNGIVEMIKHGLIVNAAYFEFLDTNFKAILEHDPKILEKAIADSCRIKKEIVEEDEKEGGKRNLVNLGHTIGHALENLTNYQISHGHAVAIGILVEAMIAKEMKMFTEEGLERIFAIFHKYGIPLTLPQAYSYEQMLPVMALDKKSLKKVPRFVILRDIGDADPCDFAYCRSVDEHILKKSINWMNDALCSH